MAVNNLNSGVGIQPTIVDAKGDLIAGTANDAVNRLAVGTNGQVLVADSGETTGLKWNDPGTVGGLVHIETRTVSAVSAESFNNVFSANYDNYKIISNLTGSGAAALHNLRFRVGGSDNSTSNYIREMLNVDGVSVAGLRQTGQTSWGIGSIETSARSFSVVEIINPFNTDPTGGFGLNGTNFTSTSTIQFTNINYGQTQSLSFDGFTIFPASGSMSGSISVYAYAKA